jgi:hypothetical protein
MLVINNFSESAITINRIQAEFDSLYDTKEMRDRLSLSERTSELRRICDREGISYKGFSYLEVKLLGKEWAAQEQAKKDNDNWVENNGALNEEVK